jgi:hypothetical protein
MVKRRRVARRNAGRSIDRGDARDHRREAKRLTDRDLEGGTVTLNEHGQIALGTCPPLRKHARRGLELDLAPTLHVDDKGCLALTPTAAVARVDVDAPTAQKTADSLDELLRALQSAGIVKR